MDSGFKTAEDSFYADQLKAKVMQHKEKEKLEREASEIYFMEWIDSVSEEEKAIILKNTLNITDGDIDMFNDTTKKKLLKSYYMEKNWAAVLEGLKAKRK